MSILGKVDLTDAQSAGDFPPLPEDLYTVTVKDAKIKEVPSEERQTLVVTYEILSGKYSGRFLFDNINFEHKNEMTRNIARGALLDLSTAAGFEPRLLNGRKVCGLNDEADLVGKNIVVKTKTSKDGKYTNIASYKSLGTAPSATKINDEVPF